MTGYPLAVQKEIIEKSSVKIDTSLSYCHYTLHDRSLVTSDYMTFMKSRGIDVLNASPISMGLLSSQGPQTWHPAPEFLRSVCQEALQYCQDQGVDLARMALLFTLENEDIPTTFVSTPSRDMMLQNIACAEQGATPQEKAIIDHLFHHIFKQHGDLGWEGLEVLNYWTNLGKALTLQQLYPSHANISQ
eukprot:TRINITY_DN6836_c0_g1_i1.p1 TRINITY_DN6836_c0_g1~~TRINITY_DN6836_c0_g1_i1.p1  ORF type:complete len:189 (-),score=36.31 TRINITY_DN6836_c0_g1_i1:63-629(-)